MRILPIALYSYTKKLSDSEIQELTNNVSALTHRHESVQLVCFIYVMYVIDLLNDIDKDTAYMNMRKRKYNYSQESIDLYSRLLKEDIKELKIDDINSSGYIVDTIEASFWCLLTYTSYENTIIEAINLGQDTDTIAGIAGAMAGIVYGFDNVPKRWLNKLQSKNYLFEMFNKFEQTISSKAINQIINRKD